MGNRPSSATPKIDGQVVRDRPLRRRVLLIGFERAASESIRRASSRLSDFDVRIYSRQNQDDLPQLLSLDTYHSVMVCAKTVDNWIDLTTSNSRLAQRLLVICENQEALDKARRELPNAFQTAVWDEANAGSLLTRSLNTELTKPDDCSDDAGSNVDEAAAVVVLNKGNQLIFLDDDAKTLPRGELYRAVEQIAASRNQPPFIFPLGGESSGSVALGVNRFSVNMREVIALTLAGAGAQRISDSLLPQTGILDSLTNLPNRDGFLQLVERWKEESPEESAALVALDIRRLFELNEALGLDEANKIISLVGNRIVSSTRTTDLVGHIGNGHFAILATGIITSDLAAKFARGAVHSASEEVHTDIGPVTLDICAGVSILDTPSLTPAELLRRAESALFKSKKLSRSHSVEVFDVHNSVEQRHHFRMEQALREAVINNEFKLVYQPLIDASGRVMSAEALLRWIHPEWGPQNPGEFVPVLEETGLIHTAGLWIVREACEQLVRWHEAGYDHMKLNVNLSPLQFTESLPAKISEIIQQTGVSTAHLRLEITESVFLVDSNIVESCIGKLDEMGLDLVIDDFGVGFCSFSYLKRIKVTGMKIDRGYVAGLLEDERDDAIVRSLVEIGHGFKLALTAEGVEKIEQARLLFKMGATYLQGFLFSQGIPGEAFTEKFLDSAHVFTVE